MQASITKYEFKSGLPVEFEIIPLDKLYSHHADMLTTPHRTGFYHILWFREGTPVHWVDFEPIQIQPGTLLFLNKDRVQRFDVQADAEGYAILFTADFFNKDLKYLHGNILFNDLMKVAMIHLSNNTRPFSELVDLMQWELAHLKDAGQPDILHNLLHNFLLYAEREYRQQAFTELKKNADLDYLLLFREMLEVHYQIQKQVQFYARELLVTEKRLNTATSNTVGKTPKEMIDDRVMLEAKRLLAHTHGTIKEIGYTLGYEEPTNFIKYFKKHDGRTPVEFREQFLRE
ncbi:helix-turn-helix transcriptional regulator [Chitinophaga sp.]|uniref:AraC family transcriptional regulator n=1 Tax=Chitinophaga sp. TaxID=1869181 RepID=UPI0031CDEB78